MLREPFDIGFISLVLVVIWEREIEAIYTDGSSSRGWERIYGMGCKNRYVSDTQSRGSESFSESCRQDYIYIIPKAGLNSDDTA